ncbi:MAG: hypothetical protein ACK6EB_24095, partial [Planctomyces sp.]
MISSWTALRRLATLMQMEGPAVQSIRDRLARSLATVSGVKLELAAGTVLQLEQQAGRGDQFQQGCNRREAGVDEVQVTAGLQGEPLDRSSGSGR